MLWAHGVFAVGRGGAWGILCGIEDSTGAGAAVVICRKSNVVGNRHRARVEVESATQRNEFHRPSIVCCLLALLRRPRNPPH